MLKYLLFFIIVLISNNLLANCNFKSSDFFDELTKPSNIEVIEVRINDYRSWVKEGLRILTSTRSSILKENKKNFKGNVRVKYEFGECIYKARIRKMGDWKDHIDLLEGGKLLTSVDIHLYEGNILNAVDFKLLIPETRNGINEIIGSIILKHLGFISPETFIIKGSINNTKSNFIFQEEAEKELIERNLRREGPIFEGDESLLWDYENFEEFELEKIALSRLVNDNYSKKNKESTIVSLESFLKIQNAYLEYVLQKTQNQEHEIFLQPNSTFNSKIFLKYHLILFAMNGEHALRPHNRKFYYNIFIQDFEPIYYDGDLRLGEEYEREFISKAELNYILLSLNEKDFDSLIENLNFFLDNDEIYETILARINKEANYNFDDFIFNINTIIENLNILKNLHSNLVNSQVDIQNYQTDFEEKKTNYINNSISSKIESKIFYFKGLKENNFLIDCIYPYDCFKEEVDLIMINELMSRNTINQKRSTLIGNYFNNSNNFIQIKPFIEGEILYSNNANIRIDKKNKRIYLNQSFPLDWFVLRNVTLNNWSIFFNGIKPIDHNELPLGLTGCVTFYNSIFDNVNLYGDYGGCEDTINIVNSKGNIKSAEVTNAYSDAIDLDFSSIEFKLVNIINATNDCIDFSGGKYYAKKINLKDCGDKALSIGEQSIFKAIDIYATNSNFGVASKDSSLTEIFNANMKNVKICLAAYNKKQEYNGAFLKVENLNCSNYFNYINMDNESEILIKNNIEE